MVLMKHVTAITVGGKERTVYGALSYGPGSEAHTYLLTDPRTVAEYWHGVFIERHMGAWRLHVPGQCAADVAVEAK